MQGSASSQPWTSHSPSNVNNSDTASTLPIDMLHWAQCQALGRQLHLLWRGLYGVGCCCRPLTIPRLLLLWGHSWPATLHGCRLGPPVSGGQWWWPRGLRSARRRIACVPVVVRLLLEQSDDCVHLGPHLHRVRQPVSSCSLIQTHLSS